MASRTFHCAVLPARPTTTASSVQASTSAIAALASAIPPMRVRCRPRSVRMRASTGNAVADIAVPMNSAKVDTCATW